MNNLLLKILNSIGPLGPFCRPTWTLPSWCVFWGLAFAARLVCYLRGMPFGVWPFLGGLLTFPARSTTG